MNRVMVGMMATVLAMGVAAHAEEDGDRDGERYRK